jgi:diguanylate cyclase (GGDEF)-like protein
MAPTLSSERNIDHVFEPALGGLDSHPMWAVLIALAATAGATWLGQVGGAELSLAALYLGPVAIMSWYLGRVQGWVWCGIVTVASLVAELTTRGAPVGTTIVVWNTVTTLALSLVVVEVLTRLRGALETEHDLARTDALTGVANTRSFKELAVLELERSRRYGRTFTLASLDLDRFKAVNDTLGHATGDRLLHDVAQAIRHRLRRVDIVARIGGDEFVVLLPETNAAAAAVALEHVREALQELADGYDAGVKASFGAVTFVSPPESVEEMLQLADVAMYQAKKAGGDRVESLTISRQPVGPGPQSSAISASA